MNIFIIEDSQSVRKRLKSMLRGFPGIAIAGTGKIGRRSLATVKRIRPDVIICDVEMLRPLKFDFLESLELLGLNKRVIAITSDPHPRMLERCRGLGIKHCLDSSLEFRRIITVIAGLMRRKQAGVTSQKAGT
jgi:DNA-binding NarL/FixJ family response regulator